MKKLLSLALCLIGLGAIAQPIQKNPLTTNAPAAMTNAFQQIPYPWTNTFEKPSSSVNLESLWGFRNSMLHSNRPIRVVIMYDLNTYPYAAMDPLKGLLNKEGGLIAGGGNEGDYRLDLSANAWMTANGSQPYLFLSTDGYINITNSGTATWSRRTTGLYTNILADSIQAFFLTGPRAGSFTISTNTGAGWGTVATINDFEAGATNLVYTNFTVARTNYSVRATQVTGTNRIFTIAVYDSTTNNLLTAPLINNSGGSIEQMSTNLVKVNSNFWKGINPDLVIVQDSGIGTEKLAAFDAMEQWWTNTPSADFVYCGSIWQAGYAQAELEAYNNTLRALAIKNKRGFFDAAYFIPNTYVATNWINAGLMDASAIHPTAGYGCDILNAGLWKGLLSESLNNPFFASPSRFTGPKAQPYFTSQDLVVSGNITSYKSNATIMLQTDNHIVSFVPGRTATPNMLWRFYSGGVNYDIMNWTNQGGYAKTLFAYSISPGPTNGYYLINTNAMSVIPAAASQNQAGNAYRGQAVLCNDYGIVKLIETSGDGSTWLYTNSPALIPRGSFTTDAKNARIWNSNNASLYVRSTNGTDKLLLAIP